MFGELSIKELTDLKNYVKDYKNEFRETVDVPDFLKFGCEIEFNTRKSIPYYEKKIKNDKYDIVYDVSGTSIIEVISPILYNTKEDWDSLRETLLKIKYGNIDHNTGGHIHYDSSIIKDENLISLLKFWFIFEEVIYDFAKGEFNELRRYVDYYAKKLDNLDFYIDKFENNKSKDLRIFNCYNKYYGLNISNHVRYGDSCWIFNDTYEVRVPNGSLDINIWQNNVEFFANFIKFANEKSNRELINDMYKYGKLDNDYNNKILLADLIYKNEESKIRFLNQFELNKSFNENVKKKGLLSIFR